VKPTITMRTALADTALLGAVLSGATWDPWRALLIASMGEDLTKPERRLFTKHTGRKREPGQRVEEAAFIIGRRGGKDRAAATLATYTAGCCEHPEVAPGERGVVLLIAPDMKQASITLGYIVAAFEGSPILRQLIANQTQDTLALTNQIDITVRAASFRRLRGITCCAVIATEAAFWYDDTSSSNPDVEILNAARPALATTGGPLIIITSPYARRGETWNIYNRHFGPQGDPLILVAQGTSRDFNSTLPHHVVERALQRDPAAARADYLAEFRSDLEQFLSQEAINACVSRNVTERPRLEGVTYFGFCDPSGGSRDDFVSAVAHREGSEGILDAIRVRKAPCSPEAAVSEQAQFFRSYNINHVRGDRYGGMLIPELFAKHGIAYKPSDPSKSEIYLAMLGAVNSGLVYLLDHQPLLNQLGALERTTARGGRDQIDHAKNGHDDIANAAMGALQLALARPRETIAEISS
jgi:hypothetical protein